MSYLVVVFFFFFINPAVVIITIVIIMTITGIVSVMHEPIEQHDEEMIVNSIISLLLD